MEKTMIRNRAIGVSIKSLMDCVNQLTAVCRYGRDIVPAAPDFLRVIHRMHENT